MALDGTKIAANASKHKAKSHERMLKRVRQLEGQIRALLRKAEITDAQEDGQVGKGKRGNELPEEPERRSSRLEWNLRLIWKQKLLQPRPQNGTNKLKRLSRRQQ